jgi:hypothetical protein
MTKSQIATEAIDELDVVALLRSVEGYEVGTQGTVVSADAQESMVTVEIDDEGETLDLITCDRMDLALIQRARDVRGRRSRNGQTPH